MVVDPIGAKPASSLDRRIAPVAPGSPAPAARPAADDRDTPARTTTLSAAARHAGAAPPIDLDRVETLRGQIANGSFKVSPDNIADRLIGLQLEWNAK